MKFNCPEKFEKTEAENNSSNHPHDWGVAVLITCMEVTYIYIYIFFLCAKIIKRPKP
jgi:Ni,Fe-hydrogenase maturation factor